MRLSLEFIEFIEKCNGRSDKKEIKLYNPNKLNNTREMLEIASRSALQLGDFKLAVNCVNKLASTLSLFFFLFFLLYNDTVYTYYRYQMNQDICD